MAIDKIPRLYEGAHAIVAAPGPSLTKEVVEKLRDVRDRYAIIGVGDTYRIIDFLDEHYACDARWWRVHGTEVNQLRPNLRSWCHDDEGTEYGAIQVHGKGSRGFSTDPAIIHYGANSGYQTLNLCYHWGFTKMILVGYNMQKVNNQSHFFKDRHKSLSLDSPYNRFVKNYDTIQKDIRDRIINCTPDSALTAFKKQSLEDTI